MFLDVAGFAHEKGTISVEYPERRVKLTGPESAQSNYKWDDGAQCCIPLDHISVHSNGLCHMKSCSRTSKRVLVGQAKNPISADSPRFLDLHVISDSGKSYQSAAQHINTEAKKVVISCDPESSVDIRLLFSGGNYPVEQFLPSLGGGELPIVSAAIRLISGPLKAVGLPIKLPAPRPPGAPPGTILAFRFFLSEEECIEKCYNIV